MVETTDRRREQWGRLLFEVHTQVYENYTARNVWTPDGSPVDIGNPDEVAAVMARARESLAK